MDHQSGISSKLTDRKTRMSTGAKGQQPFVFNRFLDQS